MDGEKYTKKALTAIFIEQSMTLLEAYAPHYTIAYMTITAADVSRQLMADLYVLHRKSLVFQRIISVCRHTWRAMSIMR